MKSIVLLLILILTTVVSPVVAQTNKVQRCTEQQLPLDSRKKYIRQATEFLQNYYKQLLLNVDNTVIHQDFIEYIMLKGKMNYKPEFILQLNKDSRYLLPEQYLLELNKLFTGRNMENLEFSIDNIFIDQRDFFLPNLVSCFVEATYDITLMDGNDILFKRKCRAQCLFPNAISYIHIKLMLVEPIKDLIAYNPINKRKEATDDINRINMIADKQLTKDEMEKIYKETKNSMGSYWNDQGYKIIEMLAEKGHADSQFDIGWKYLNKQDSYQNKKNAVKWFTRAAEQGHKEAQYNLGRSYELGRGTSKNMRLAAHWWLKAAEQGHKESQYYLAICYFNGEGVDRDEKSGIKWLTSSAKMNYSLAQIELAERYLYGRGVSANKKLAKHWYLKAAERGSQKAKEALKKM